MEQLQEVSLAHLMLISCCAAQFLTGHNWHWSMSQGLGTPTLKVPTASREKERSLPEWGVNALLSALMSDFPTKKTSQVKSLLSSVSPVAEPCSSPWLILPGKVHPAGWKRRETAGPTSTCWHMSPPSWLVLCEKDVP